MDFSFFPKINAFLNACAGILLFMGWRAIKAGKIETHRKLMVSAFITSILFLCSYVTYHYLKQGVTHYPHEGSLKIIYFTILGTHTPLAIIIVPFAIAALIFALQKNYQRHTRITKWLLPVWLYVSVTGVVIYLMLYVF